LDRQPAATISFLCSAIRAQAEFDIGRTAEESSELGHKGFLHEIEILRRAQLGYPADYWINRRLGLSLIWMKSPDLVSEGMGYLRVALALRPHEAETLIHLGKGYEYLRQYDQVFACYQNALALAPQDAAILNHIAWSLVASSDEKLRDSQEAVSFAQMSVDLEPQNGAHRETLGVARYRIGHWNEAIESLEKSLELQGDNGVALLFLAMAYSHMGEQDQARQSYDLALQWMEKESTHEEQLLRFRVEAEELLKIADKKPATKTEPK
jgi:tetratricopeptide (TPR) repeat protein